MPAKGSTGTKRRPPLRSDRGVKLYGPTESKPLHRVVAAGQVERTCITREEADELFDQMVAWAKENIQVAPKGIRTIDTLCDRRLEELAAKNRERGTIDKAEGLMRLFVRPVIGDVAVLDWTEDHCREVINAAEKTCGAERIIDLGACLRALVSLAHKKPAWLLRDDDPMADLDYTRKATLQDEAPLFVPYEQRPATDQVDSLSVAMAERGLEVMAYFAGRPNKPVRIDRTWGWLYPQVTGKAGCRMGEAFGLTVQSCCLPRCQIEAIIMRDSMLNAAQRADRLDAIIDLPHGYAIDPGRRVMEITEVVEWKGSQPFIRPVDQEASGKAPKNKKRRYTVYPRSLLAPIVTRCTELLERFGPEQGPMALLFPEHDHTFALVPVDKKKPRGAMRWQDQDWWDRSEFRRSMYLKAVRKAEFWPDEPLFACKNLRHHFATWAKENGYPDVLIRDCMGHWSFSYTQERYFRSGADTIGQGMAASDDL
jgi:hypothetical protein